MIFKDLIFYKLIVINNDVMKKAYPFVATIWISKKKFASGKHGLKSIKIYITMNNWATVKRVSFLLITGWLESFFLRHKVNSVLVIIVYLKFIFLKKGLL